MSFFHIMNVASQLKSGENTDVTLTNTKTGDQATFMVEKTENSVNVSARPYDKNAKKLIDQWTAE